MPPRWRVKLTFLYPWAQEAFWRSQLSSFCHSSNSPSDGHTTTVCIWTRHWSVASTRGIDNDCTRPSYSPLFENPHKSLISSLRDFLHPPLTSSVTETSILNTVIWNTPKLRQRSSPSAGVLNIFCDMDPFWESGETYRPLLGKKNVYRCIK